MAARLTFIPLSQSTAGRGIKVAATATAGTLLHATGVSATVVDQLFLWAVIPVGSTDRVLTVEFGDVTSPDDLIALTIPAKGGLVPIVQGLGLSGTGAAARNVRAFAAAANEVVIFGHVVRMTP